MTAENLWAPWRLGYVSGAEQPPKPTRALNWLLGADRECFICRGVAEGADADRENLIVARGPAAVVVLNRYPYNNGHLLVAPLLHQGELTQLSDEQHLALMTTINRFTALLQRLMNPQGFNIGLNLGRAAGAGLPGHLHWHIVPRWNGDTNFMPALAGIRVIPQSLDALWEMLVEALGASTQSKKED